MWLLRFTIVVKTQSSSNIALRLEMTHSHFLPLYTMNVTLLIDDNGNLKINEGQLIDGLDNGCTPVIGSE